MRAVELHPTQSSKQAASTWRWWPFFATSREAKEDWKFGAWHQLVDVLMHMNSDQNPCDIPLYWLVNRHPYNGLL